ncbi:nucleotidyl transferase AbiEii/AbiGii toxin family protein [Flagellimonas lutaonensis]|uniref:DUF6036 domain-containing protein n=1 Tax=Flagellimonas lutaonensis TaxID=516051 RepID=A0A0D5YSS8_9FLAO|nr:nucleotidyl transferase AbiEii/AbiGii toxin family protein [Allomuricauda lutaonensis]AKA35315.1 hypothetical protein VC82_1703 [Allomuricauda lutaonensis]
MRQWKENIDTFIKIANKFGVRMIMVGGGAVNFHGYQRHSADVDFWIDTADENLEKLIKVFDEMGYQIDDFPDQVKNREQNISVKFSPVDLNLELITNFSVNKSFEEVFDSSEIVTVDNGLTWRVLSLTDLISSKLKSSRPKDLLDIQELRRIHNLC